jgi:hypothetical protein
VLNRFAFFGTIAENIAYGSARARRGSMTPPGRA